LIRPKPQKSLVESELDENVLTKRSMILLTNRSRLLNSPRSLEAVFESRAEVLVSEKMPSRVGDSRVREKRFVKKVGKKPSS
jgi:hypothetical protein